MQVNHFLNLARQHRMELQQALAALPTEILERHAKQVETLEQLREKTLDEQVEVNLPSLDQATLDAVEQFTGYGPFAA
ncbi:MAG: hypothetical protein ACUVR8_03985 [Acidobacteriota bacterium]